MISPKRCTLLKERIQKMRQNFTHTAAGGA